MNAFPKILKATLSLPEFTVAQLASNAGVTVPAATSFVRRRGGLLERRLGPRAGNGRRANIWALTAEGRETVRALLGLDPDEEVLSYWNVTPSEGGPVLPATLGLAIKELLDHFPGEEEREQRLVSRLADKRYELHCCNSDGSFAVEEQVFALLRALANLELSGHAPSRKFVRQVNDLRGQFVALSKDLSEKGYRGSLELDVLRRYNESCIHLWCVELCETLPSSASEAEVEVSVDSGNPGVPATFPAFSLGGTAADDRSHTPVSKASGEVVHLGAVEERSASILDWQSLGDGLMRERVRLLMPNLDGFELLLVNIPGNVRRMALKDAEPLRGLKVELGLARNDELEKSMVELHKKFGHARVLASVLEAGRSKEVNVGWDDQPGYGSGYHARSSPRAPPSLVMNEELSRAKGSSRR